MIYSDDFCKFWENYPAKRGGKKAAVKSFDKCLKEGYMPSDIIDGAQRYTDYCKAQKTDPKFICHATTFLNQGRFEDQYPEIQPLIKEEDPAYARWRLRLKTWRSSKTAYWPDMWGPKPGEEGCTVPRELLN